MENKKIKSEKKPFTIILNQEDYDKLTELAQKESRPRAQMARVIIERTLRAEEKNETPNRHPAR